MAKRKTTQQKELEDRLQANLKELGRLIIAQSSRASKISNLQKDHLRDSGGKTAKPYNVLTLRQFGYGKYNTPKGQATPKDRSNIKNTPLLNAIDANMPEGVKIIIKDITKLITAPISNK